MSVVTVQLGQCGNQIGQQLFTTLYEDASNSLRSLVTNKKSTSPYYELSTERYFHSNGACSAGLTPRAVLVDMESKVVQQTLTAAKHSKVWEYDGKCVYTEKRGSGNNWANGYFQHGPVACGDILDMVQRQVERCDTLAGFLVLMSVAGGTGSGVGARVTESLRDCYPNSILVNQIVWPYASGEVIVQDYNTLLTTAHLQKVSDAILLLQNDQLHKVCSKLLQLKEITFHDINCVICHSLASILQPALKFEHYSQPGTSNDSLLYRICSLNDFHEQLCPDPMYKILSLKSIPQMPERSHAYTRYLWSGLLKHLRQMLITDSPVEEGMDWTRDLGGQRSYQPTSTSGVMSSRHSQYNVVHTHDNVNKSLANLLILRGNELNTADDSFFKDERLYSKIVPKSCTCSVWCSRHAFNKYEKTCTLVSNSQGCIQPLSSVCRKAWNMYTSKAYVHQYEKYGLETEEFLDSFVTVEQTIKNYATIG